MDFDKIKIPAGDIITADAAGNLTVGDHPVVGFIEGDGIGADIMSTSLAVWNAAVEKAYGGRRAIRWCELYAGDKARRVYGSDIYLPEETLTALKLLRVAVKGPLSTPIGGGVRSLNVVLRQKLDLYACVRLVRYFPGVPSPVKHPELTDMVVFRENTEDIYAGIEWAAGTPEAQKVINFLQSEMQVTNIRFPETSGIGIKPISRDGSERLMRAALDYAIANRRKSVTIVHKGNIMKFTEGAFKNWCCDLVRREYSDRAVCYADCGGVAPAGKVLVKDCICDAFLQQILTRPAEYDVIAAPNLNGDYISDALAACVGGIGIAPGANINNQTGHATFEATHGTAPKYANLDKVNPSSLLLSGEMMLRHIGWPEAADLVIRGIERAIADKIMTYDLARLTDGATEVGCSAFGRAVIERM